MTPETLAADPEALLESCAQRIVDCGLEVPAVLFLEMSRPLSFLLGQSVMLGSPALAPFLGIEGVENLSTVLSRPENVDRLLNRIEDLSVEPASSAPVG